MLEDYLTTSVTISRKVITGNKTTFAGTGTVLCHIQPLSPSFQNGQWGRLQKEYLLLSFDEVRIGDKLLDTSGNKYEVFGQVDHKFRTGHRHYECHLRGL